MIEDHVTRCLDVQFDEHIDYNTHVDCDEHV